MSQPRKPFLAGGAASLIIAALCAVLLPLGVAAQATHSGTYSLGAGGGHVIYQTRLFLLQGGAFPDIEQENVLVTICPTSGHVIVSIDGVTVWDPLDFCLTRNAMVRWNIALGGKPDAEGTYSVSVNLLPPAKK